MSTSRSGHPALLPRGSLMRIAALADDRIECARGLIWLTQEGDPVDRVVAAGENFVVTRPGLVLVNALGHDAVVRCPDPARCTVLLPNPGLSRAAPSLGEEIARIGPRIDSAALRALPPTALRDAVRREARRMQSQVAWLVLQHGRRALRACACALLDLPSALLRKKKGAGSNCLVRQTRPR